MVKEGANLLLFNEATHDLDVNTLWALELVQPSEVRRLERQMLGRLKVRHKRSVLLQHSPTMIIMPLLAE